MNTHVISTAIMHNQPVSLIVIAFILALIGGAIAIGSAMGRGT